MLNIKKAKKVLVGKFGELRHVRTKKRLRGGWERKCLKQEKH